MRRDQKRDFLLGPILKYSETEKFPADAGKGKSRSIKKGSANFQVQGRVVYRKAGETLLLAVPHKQHSNLY